MSLRGYAPVVVLCSFDFAILVFVICGLYMCVCVCAILQTIKNKFHLFSVWEFVLRWLTFVWCDVRLFGLFVSF